MFGEPLPWTKLSIIKKKINGSNVTFLTPDYAKFNKGIVTDQENEETNGVSAMSLSDMTSIQYRIKGGKNITCSAAFMSNKWT